MYREYKMSPDRKKKPKTKTAKKSSGGWKTREPSGKDSVPKREPIKKKERFS